ncbi:MAG TPA: hypothetical protein VGL20_12335 [Candidatus Dormibacteraeota bacterium]
MNMLRLAPVLSVAGALALGVGAASASGVMPLDTLPAAPVSSPVLGGTVSSVTGPVGGVVSGTTGAVSGAVAGVTAPVAPLVTTVTPKRQTTSTTPPPPGNATANGAHVNPLDTCVSCTGAGAQGGSSQSGATALRVVGQTLSGGSSSSTGGQSGQLIATPANPLMTLAIANWMTAAEAGTGGSSSSRSRSALVDLGAGSGQVATVAVLEAASAATFDGAASHGAGASNGVNLSAGNGALVLVLLHSEANSDGGRSAYLASINGTTLGGSNQDGDIPVTVPGVITIHLLTVGASGGIGGAAIGSVNDVLSIPGQVASVLASTAGGAAAPAAVTPPAPTTGIASAASTAPSAHASGPGVPLTGLSVGAGGLVLLTSGLALLGASARRRRGATA